MKATSFFLPKYHSLCGIHSWLDVLSLSLWRFDVSALTSCSPLLHLEGFLLFKPHHISLELGTELCPFHGDLQVVAKWCLSF